MDPVKDNAIYRKDIKCLSVSNGIHLDPSLLEIPNEFLIEENPYLSANHIPSTSHHFSFLTSAVYCLKRMLYWKV
jgi:hypothetical protein